MSKKKTTNGNKVGEKKRSMKTAFVRVSYHNETKSGIVDYTFDDLVAAVKNWNKSKSFDYFMISHNLDESPHAHIVLCFASPTLYEQVKNKFPYGFIESARSIKQCVQYLVHYNHPEKIQYKWDDIVTNVGSLDKYKVRDYSASKGRLDELITLIDNGIIREFNLTEYCTIDVYTNHKSKLDNALEYYRRKIMTDVNRKVQVIFITGPAGVGKTTYAKRYCEGKKLSYCISSSSNDPLQDYKGQDVLILDDLRDDSFKYHDFLKVIDNHTGSTIKSRYINKAFFGSMIIITSCKPLEEWYGGVDEDRKQFYRRVSLKIDMTPETVKFSCPYDSEVSSVLSFKPIGKITNPIKANINNAFSLAKDLASGFGLNLNGDSFQNDELIEFLKT